MKYFAFEEWAAASAAYDAEDPPYWHAKVVPDAFTALSGILWSVSYILMATKGFKDKSYSMPIYSLCLNIAWETVFGFVYGPGRFNQLVFVQWMIVDAFLVYITVKFGRDQWKHQPLVANNLGWIMLVGYALSTALHLSIAATFVPVIGRRVVAFTAWPLQVFISVGSFAQIISRGHSQGHSWGIW
jgi:paspaline synthase